MKTIFLIFIFLINSALAFEHITHENFHKKIKKGNVVVNFYASWCSVCKNANKNLKAFEKETKEKVKIYNVDISEEIQLTKEYDAVTVPLLVYFKNGRLLAKENGIKTKEQIKDSIQKNFH